MKLAKFFDVPVDFLLDGKAASAPVQPENREEAELLLMLRRASPDLREAVRTMLEHAAPPRTEEPASTEH